MFDRGFNCEKEKKYRTRDQIYAALTKRYKCSEIIRHFYNNDEPVPLWAIFEELMLGELSAVIDALEPDLKLTISASFGISKVYNTDGSLLPHVILAIKDLRNGIAHNKVVFDGRYMEFKKRKSMKMFLSAVTGIPNIGCDCLLDDVILICFLMHNLGFPKTQILKLVNQLDETICELKKALPNELFQKVAGKMFARMPAVLSYVK